MLHEARKRKLTAVMTREVSASPIAYTVDESRIAAAQDGMIAANRELRDHVGLINAALDFIHRMVIAEPHKSDGHLILLRLSVRCFNSAAAALRLVRCGYWQPAFAVMRDLLETSFLLDLLSRDATEVTRWRTLPEGQRKKAFAPVKVREKLDSRDGCTERKRKDAYDRLSAYAAHATPEGFVVISLEMMTQVGPFPSEKNLRAALQELARHVAAVSVIIGTIVRTEAEETLALKAAFYNGLQRWSSRYLGLRQNSMELKDQSNAC